MGVYSELVHFTTRHITFVNEGLAKLHTKSLSDPLGLRSSKKRSAAERKKEELVVPVADVDIVTKKVVEVTQAVQQTGEITLNSFAQKVVKMLEKLISENVEEHVHDCFASNGPCSLSLEAFVERVILGTNKYVEESFGMDSTGVCCAVLAIEYLRRSKFHICEHTMHRYFLTAYVLAFKVLDDVGANNSWWAYVIGCCLQDVNKMEASFCNKLQWKLAADEHEYQAIISEILCA